MTREQLDKIIEEAPEAFASLLGDLQPKIIEAAKATLEESQDSESGKAVVKVGLSLAIDLCTSPVSWHVEASVGVRHKVKSEAHVADTSPELPGLEKARKVILETVEAAGAKVVANASLKKGGAR